MTKVSIKSLLDAGSHFGHQTRRWNPKMKPYIFGSRGDIYIIDLKQTLIGLDRAYTFISETARKGGTVLFVGTKKQAQEAVADAANRCGMPYVNARWLGGMLTNFVTIRSRVTRMEELEAMEADGRMELLPKKEQILLAQGARQAADQPERHPQHEEASPRPCSSSTPTAKPSRSTRPVVSTSRSWARSIPTAIPMTSITASLPTTTPSVRCSLLAEFIADAVIAGVRCAGDRSRHGGRRSGSCR